MIHLFLHGKTYVRVSSYRRYVDDTFCVFETEQDALLFFDFISTRHPNMSVICR